jgi:hypothetical protein
MKKLFLLCSIVLLLSSCTTTRLERQENRRKAKCEKYGCFSSASDSMMIIRETITIKEDTTIFIHVPGKIIHDTTVMLEQDPVSGLMNSKKSVLEVDFATSYAWVENGKLKHELIQKDTLIRQVIEGAKVLIKENEILKEKLTRVVPPEQINYVTPWQWFQIGAGRIFLFLIILTAFYFLIRSKGGLVLKYLERLRIRGR